MHTYYRIPDYPESPTSTGVLTRLLDGLGFRFYWSTEGLRPDDYSFRPGPDTMSIEELVEHIWDLVNWVSSSALKRSYRKPKGSEKIREDVLVIIQDLRNTFIEMDEDKLGKLRIRGKPFWHIVNGPISDALTHVGQINSFRRLAGNPVAGANVFTGEPPKKKG
jgi:hypothetical protein